MNMGMKAKVLAPGMKNRCVPNRCPQILFVFGQFLKRLRHALEQKLVAVLLVAINQCIEFLRDGEDNVEVANIQQVGLLCIDPSLLGQCLALGAVTVPTGIVGRSFVFAAWAPVHVPTKTGCSATPDGVHSFVLRKRQLVVCSIDIAKLFKNILHLRHRPVPLTCAHAFSEAYPEDL